jgi:trehalose 6-phosphate synthase
MMVTPLRDGMNLVAKEYVASRIHDDGALVLSEFTGAAEELRQAWLVNPYDTDGLKAAILSADRAPAPEKSHRMAQMRAQVFTYDVQHWARAFLTALDTAAEASAPVEMPAEQPAAGIAPVLSEPPSEAERS